MIIKVDTDIELRLLKQSDSIDIFNMIDSQREYFGKWLPFVESTKQLSDTKNFVKSIVNTPKDLFEYIFTIRKQKEFIGLIGFKSTDKLNKKTEIGYWISKNNQKQGIVSKAVERLCDFAFNKLDLNRIQIKCAVENKASINIPKRLDFKFEGVERHGELLSGNVFTDLVVYSKLKSDY